MEFYGNRLKEDQVEAIVASMMEERYGINHDREPTVDDIRFALKYYLKQMTGEPSIYIEQNDHGEWVWEIVEEEMDDEAHYEHQN